SLWSSMLFGPIDAPLLVTSLISGFTAVSLTLQVRRRGQLIRAGFWVGLAIWLLSLTFGLIGPINWFYPTANDWGMVGLQSALAIGNGILTATLVGGGLPILEIFFKTRRTSPGWGGPTLIIRCCDVCPSKRPEPIITAWSWLISPKPPQKR